MTKLAQLKQQCAESRKYCTRQLGRIQTEAELLDFVTRRQIEIPGFSPNFQMNSTGLVNQYHVEAEAIFTPVKPYATAQSIPPPRQSTSGKPPGSISNVRELVVHEIGRKWKQFGRALDLSEAFLDELEERHPRKLQERLEDILKEMYAKENPVPRIKAALEKIGRKDVAVKIVL